MFVQKAPLFMLLCLSALCYAMQDQPRCDLELITSTLQNKIANAIATVQPKLARVTRRLPMVRLRKTQKGNIFQVLIVLLDSFNVCYVSPFNESGNFV